MPVKTVGVNIRLAINSGVIMDDACRRGGWDSKSISIASRLAKKFTVNGNVGELTSAVGLLEGMGRQK